MWVIQGGQMRRLTIGVEIMNLPELICKSASAKTDDTYIPRCHNH